ncbi:MAG: hypothetical protein IK024_06440 [Treponema sp.]|nr:hypothetical protein [Treponema sp.]
MSSFSNGGYVPSNMDFSDWIEYLEEKRNAERYALIDKEFEDFYKEFFDLETEEEEEEFELSIPEEALSALKIKADSFISDVKKSLNGMSKSEKCKTLAKMQEETHNRLLFNFIRMNQDAELAFIVRSPSDSFLEEERRAQTYNAIHTVLSTAFFDPKNRVLMTALNQYDSVLKNEAWAKCHAEHVEKWLNSKSGDSSTVFTKLLDAKLKVLSETIAQDPEQTKKKAHMRNYDMER